MSVDSDQRDDVSEDPWWWRDAPPDEPNSRELPAETDVLVVGAGLTGLCCALELARGGAGVLLVDGLPLGGGASTRSAGYLSGRAGVSKQIDLEAAVGRERANAILDEADEAYEHLQEALGRDGIDCDFEPVGRFVGAHSPGAYRSLAKKAAEYNRDGRGRFAMVPRDEQQAYVYSDFFHGGMVTENAGTLHSAKYHAGLVRLCRAAGVKIVTATRVEAILREDQGLRVVTSGGDLRARQVALCTNGYTDRAAPWHRRRIVPISSSLIATEALPEALIRTLLPKACPVIDTRRLLNLARLSPDRRHLLFGGRASLGRLTAAQRCGILRRQMVEIFPSLSDARVTHVWSGQMGFTFDFLPKIGLQDGVHYALGCNGGSGIVMLSWLGRRLAWKMLDTANRQSAFEGLPFGTHAFYAGKPWFLPFVGSWYRFRDWLEIRRARDPSSPRGVSAA